MIGPVSDAAPDPATGSAEPRHRAVGPPDAAAVEPVPAASEEAEEASEASGADLDGPVTPTFPPKPFLQLGYDRAAVDEFVTAVVLAVHNERQTRVSADDVAATRFPTRRLGGGYRMREVDDYLGVAEALLRMRATARGASAGTVPEPSHRHHPPTWWIYGFAAVLVVVIVVFTLLQT